MLPKVTIVIPFYNCRYVDRALKSALSQTYPHIEVILVDDGSTKYRSKIKPYRNRIHYIGKANGGTASALNYGMRLATGEYIAWLSSDDVFYRHKIERQINYMIAKQSQVCHTAFDQIDHRGIVRARYLGPKPCSQKELVEQFSMGDPVNGCTVIMRKDLLDRIGLFDESLRYTHDYDLWIRMLLAGVPFDYLYEPLIQYRQHMRMGTVKHRPAIGREIKSLMRRYKQALLTRASQIT
ncbi:glycosyltransferase [Paenibacillus sp. N1-5-1-14]|uniref:glycosyltransferase n=1 Tax=Paenibacillus radicibacter TaxID=2972488 RepID=UPI002159227C|nr:glycosyltransferase [Paenibacillus radicibacter]MCR8645191.1 glycosyltransferase [Paenibacillus radicibacter]